ncbi:hypothetical protein PLGE761_02405 [Pluralibacter gergoviae]|uniref:hypothetical protein n=1 Tax=Pluralibacter gergoviae TaxID=61647 RepID=UPI0007DABF8F|nr:hypothetical protein [Pluralibacter gergoviae]SUB71809.1 Uncharacterised protein [Pluralibacter gergoviae]HDS1113632.1 hypothetical protein [Pluralibacter gergoviae]
MSTEAQKKAAATYRAKNSGKARLPGVLLTDDESALLNEMANRYGSKKGAIMAGLKKLKESVDI